jgi:indolepyruvate decarboxylase
MNSTYTVADYLIERLTEIGIHHLFGVPGDYNLQFLDHVLLHTRLKWVGCTNELNAAYAADGYARCRPAAALLTTFGVGELSAINGIAGSYAEYVPVVHIVGAPPLAAQNKGELLHHSLGDGDFSHFVRMAEQVTVAQACLTNQNAVQQIDRVLRQALLQRRPVYLLLPSDVATQPTTPPVSALTVDAPVADPDSLQAFIQAAREILQNATRVSLLADFLAQRFAAREALQQWVDDVNIPHATLLLGKGLFNEQHRHFAGTYAGAGSQAEVKATIEEADVVIIAGVCFTDVVTSGFTHQIPETSAITLHPFSAVVAGRVFEDIPLMQSVEALHCLTRTMQSTWQSVAVAPPPRLADEHEILDQSVFWREIQHFLQPNDIVLVEQGTACFGAARLTLPNGCDFVSQSLWGSIGYTLPAALGMQTASPERRVVLIIGDGSAQLTIQALGSAIRFGLRPVIFVLNNQGYTVERAIHGAEQIYNDIGKWNWTAFPQAFGGSEELLSVRVSSPSALKRALANITSQRQFAWVEVVLPKMDIPELLDIVARKVAERNCRVL